MAAKTLLTLADYLALDDPDDRRFELDEGELIVSPGASFSHNKIRERLYALLCSYVEPRGLGMVTSETDFVLAVATVRRPDVAVILAEHFLRGYDIAPAIPRAPDLAFEVVSRNDRPGDVKKKTQQYLAADTAAVWLLDPQTKEAHCWATGQAMRNAELIEEPALLPGFSVSLDEIFPPAE